MTILHRVFDRDFHPGAWARATSPQDRTPGRVVLDGATGFSCALGERVRGERVLLRGALDPTWALAFFGLALAGARVVPVARAATSAELAHVARDTGARFGVDVEAPSTPIGPGLAALDPAERAGAGDTFVAEALARITAEDPLLVVYTSGTTGAPKGAILTHANLATHARVLHEAWAIDARDTLLHALPMHHVHGITVAFLTAFTAGASITYAAKFEPESVLDAMRSASVFMAVPTMWSRLVDAIEAGDRDRLAAGLRALRLFTSGSAALPASLAARIRAIAGAIPLERYGMTEIGMALSNPLDPSGRKLGYVGKPLPTVEARIVDDAGAPTSRPGALQIRGPSVFAGYWGKDPGLDFVDGWFQTGDVAERDAAGDYRLLGRSSVDILKTGGEKVSAIEVEEALREHPSIADVAVVGVPDAEWGERVVAFVVRRGALDEDGVRAFAKTRVAPFKVPKEVRFVEALPRNAMGKVQKTALRDG